MSSLPLRSLRVFAFALVAGSATALTASAADTAAPAATAKAAPEISQHTLDKLSDSVLKGLKLDDSAREAKVRTVLEDHFRAVDTWHRGVEAQLKSLWAEWSDARDTKHQDEAKAAKIAEKIDAVYASFQSQHDAFSQGLAAVLSPEQVEAVKNTMTREPGLPRTYNADLQIVPDLTEAQKKYIYETLLVAREQALDSLDKKERIALFKKQKVKVQLYIEAQGYDWKKLYSAFAKKVSEESKAAKARD